MTYVSPLAELIGECQRMFLDTHGVELTYADIGRRSGERPLTRNRVQQMASQPIKRMPEPETLVGLAKGLGVPLSVVTERAMRSAGYVVPDRPVQARQTGS